MEFIKPGTYIDFMKYRGPVITVLGIMATLSLVSLFYPGPNYGIDFAGGTEVQLQFRGDTTPAEVRAALEDAGCNRTGPLKERRTSWDTKPIPSSSRVRSRSRSASDRAATSGSAAPCILVSRDGSSAVTTFEFELDEKSTRRKQRDATCNSAE